MNVKKLQEMLAEAKADSAFFRPWSLLDHAIAAGGMGSTVIIFGIALLAIWG